MSDMNTMSKVDLIQLRRECEDMIRVGTGKISAIKYARMFTGWPLKEAKDWVESFTDAPILPRGFVELPSGPNSTLIVRIDAIDMIYGGSSGDLTIIEAAGQEWTISSPRVAVLSLIAKAQQS